MVCWWIEEVWGEDSGWGKDVEFGSGVGWGLGKEVLMIGFAHASSLCEFML